jgi:hypothetical protein
MVRVHDIRDGDGHWYYYLIRFDLNRESHGLIHQPGQMLFPLTLYQNG